MAATLSTRVPSSTLADGCVGKLPNLRNSPVVVAGGLSASSHSLDPRQRHLTSALFFSGRSGKAWNLRAADRALTGRCRMQKERRNLPCSKFFVGSHWEALQETGRLHIFSRTAGVQIDARVKASGGVPHLDDVPHLSEWVPDLQYYPNPLRNNPAYSAVRQYFVEKDDVVAQNVVVEFSNPSAGVYFRRAGPRQDVCFTGDEVRACIVTCGGLCPGLNTVIREIVCGLWESYGVRDICGIEGGYAGFYSNNTIPLTPKIVNDIHKKGGTILRTSRGGHDTGKIVSAILDHGINQVYLIGGDGTQRGAQVIYENLRKLGVKVVIAGIPKTIDNDIAVIDKSFGFDTAVEEAQRAINAAHVEAESVKNGVGLVKLMGRYSGYIAMYATLASRDVDCCLIPEIPFYVEGKGGLYEFVRKRLRENGHIVLVVAEGAGQEFIAETTGVRRSDASGNRRLLDVGLWLSQKLTDHFSASKEAITLKYIDPTYMIRAIPGNASDNVYCTLLAHSAMHGAMAGYTGFVVGPVNGRHAYIPIATAVQTNNQVSISNRMWARLISSTQQPNFMDEKANERAKVVDEFNGAVSGKSGRADELEERFVVGIDETKKDAQEKL